jgi:hypothetical protein
VIGLIAALVIGSGLAIWQLRLDAIADTEADIHSLGTVVAEQMTRSLQADDLVLAEIADRITREGVSTSQALHAAFGSPAIHDALARRLIDLPQTEAFAILDATGHFVNESRNRTMPDDSSASLDYTLFTR